MNVTRGAAVLISFIAAYAPALLVLDWLGSAIGIYPDTIIGEIFEAAKLIGSFAAGLWVSFKVAAWITPKQK